MPGHDRISFHEIELRSATLGTALNQQGIQAGDRVLIMVPMSIDLYIILIALFRIRAVAVFIDPWVGRKRLAEFAHQVAPVAFISIPKAQVLRFIPGLLPTMKLNVIVGKGILSLFNKTLSQLLDVQVEIGDIQPVSPDDPALITFTTGSTGKPKGVVRTHGFLLSQHHVLTEHLGLTENDIDLPLLPVFVLNNLANGVTSVLPAMDTREVAKADPALLYKQVSATGVTTTVGSPIIFQRLVEYCKANSLQLQNMRVLFTGGAPVSNELIMDLQGIMPSGKAHIVYGSTEAEPIASISAREVARETAQATLDGLGQCVGLPDKNTQVKIIVISHGPMDQINEVTDGGIGEIIVMGDHVNKDYYNNPEAFRKNKIQDANSDVWHRTGDVGYFDPTGRIFLVGRIDQVCMINGKHVYPLQVEPVVNGITGIDRSALFDHDDKGLCLACEFRAVPDSELLNQMKEKLSVLQIPSATIIAVSEIPMDPRHNSKIDYDKLSKELVELTENEFLVNQNVDGD